MTQALQSISRQFQKDSEVIVFCSHADLDMLAPNVESDEKFSGLRVKSICVDDRKMYLGSFRVFTDAISQIPEPNILDKPNPNDYILNGKAIYLDYEKYKKAYVFKFKKPKKWMTERDWDKHLNQ